MAAFESRDVALFRRNRLILAAGLFPFLLGAIAIVFGVATGTDDGRALGAGLGSLAITIGFVTSLLVLRGNPFRVKVPGQLVADEAGVRFAGRLIAPRRSIRAGFLIPTWGKPPLIRLDRRWPHRPLEMQINDEPTGRALLRALGLDASQVVASFTFVSRARSDIRIAVAGWAMLLLMLFGFPVVAAATLELSGPWLGIAGVLAVIALLAWIVVMAVPMKAIVGADGVLVSWFGRKRFLGYDAVRAVHPFGSGNSQGVVIHLAEGTPVKLQIQTQLTEQQNDQTTDLVTQRIQQAIATYHQNRRDREVALPERGQRSIPEWIRLLRATGGGGSADHRTAPVSREELIRIAEDPGVSPSARASAAIAASSGLDDAGRTRLRIAAESTASPDVRALLEMSAEEADEERIAPALARIMKR